MIRGVLLAALIALALPASASAADVVVNTNGDAGTGGCTAQECTLREAVAQAGPTDRVVVPAGTYTLSAGPIDLGGDTIAGAGARTTIIDVPTSNSRIFTVAATGNQVSGVTLTRGNGAGIQGPVAGGAILVQGQFAPASITVTDSIVRGNTAQGGGGIAVGPGGTLSLLRSTVSGNRSTGISGSHGGGIYLDGGTVTIVNSTISGNTATDTPTAPGNADGGGIYVAGGTLSAQNVTLAANRASGDDGIFREPAGNSTVTLNSTIVASDPARNACSGAPSAFTGNHNLSDDTSCGFTEPTDRTGNAQLGPLANNGGATDTHAIAPGSPAIDGGAGCPATDQRGVTRPAACDIGAFEYVPPPAPPPPLPPPPDDDELPPPEAGENVNAVPARGTVRIKLPGSRRYRVLAEGEQIPVGTTIDTRKGRVTLTAAGDQTATFYAGIFKLRQTSGATPLTTLVLTEKLRCAPRGAASTAAKRKTKRRLWGDGKGRFRTKGKYSAATVRGTKWLTEDRCGSTLTRVTKGRVAVRDFVTRKTVVVRAGKKYVARRRR